MTPLILNRREAAAALGISLWTLDQYIASGTLPTVNLPSSKHAGERSRRVLVAVADLEDFVARCRTKAVAR
jgi:predicted site-specific integrase-resolvase